MSGWPQRRLSDLTEILSGFAFDSTGFEDSGMLPVVRIRNVVPGMSSTFYTGSFDSKYIVDDDDILIGMDGEFNRARWCGGKALLNQRVCRIKPSSSSLDDRYLYHYLPKALKSIEDSTPFVTVKHLSVKQIRNILIPLPPISEQRRIAEILDRADALRAKRRAALAQLDTLTQSIFLDLFGDPATNPRGWPTLAMSTLFAASPVFGSMIPPSESGGSWLSLRVGNIQNWQLDLTDQKFIELPSAMVERHSVKNGDMLLARAIATQEHLGKAIVVYPHDRNWAFDSHLMRLRFRPDKAEPEFVRHLLKTDGGRQLFLKATRRSAVQFNINTKEISALKIPVPPIALQRDFVHWVLAVDVLKVSCHRSLEALDSLFASLQHCAFRGEL